MTWAKVFAALLPITHEAEKVAPHIEAEIKKIVEQVAAQHRSLAAGADAQIAHLRSQHSVQAVKDKLSHDLAEFEAFVARHRGLLKAEAAAKVSDADADAILPPLNLPAGPLGPTGATGPSA